MGALLISIILFIRFFQNFSDKKSSIFIPNSFPEKMKFFSLTNMLAAVLSGIAIALNGNGLQLDGKTLLISVFSGMALTLSSILGLLAMKSGAIALCSLFATAGLLVPCFGAVFISHTIPSVWQWVGLIIFLISSTWLIKSSQNTNTSFSIKTLLLLIGSLLANGFTMLAQTMFTVYVPNGDIAAFSLMTFLIPAVVLFALSIGGCAFAKRPLKQLPKKLVFYGVLSSVCVFFINYLATESTRMVAPIVLFSMINGGNTIIAALVGRICFNEKLSKSGVFALVIGIAALILIKSF